MTMKRYSVALASADGSERTVAVPSPTDVQAGDAARAVMQPGESILWIKELARDDARPLDAAPAQSQAGEFAPVTSEAAAAPASDTRKELRRG